MANISVGLREKVKGLHTFAELFGFDWEDDSDWTWTDVARAMADEIDAEEAEMRYLIDRLWKIVGGSKDEYEGIGTVAEIMELAPRVGKLGIE